MKKAVIFLLVLCCGCANVIRVSDDCDTAQEPLAPQDTKLIRRLLSADRRIPHNYVVTRMSYGGTDPGGPSTDLAVVQLYDTSSSKGFWCWLVRDAEWKIEDLFTLYKGVELNKVTFEEADHILKCVASSQDKNKSYRLDYLINCDLVDTSRGHNRGWADMRKRPKDAPFAFLAVSPEHAHTFQWIYLKLTNGEFTIAAVEEGFSVI